MADDRVFGEIAKPSAREVVRVRQSLLSGRTYIDVRLWVAGDEEEAHAPVPTRKGLCLAPATWRALLPVIDEAVAQAEAEG